MTPRSPAQSPIGAICRIAVVRPNHRLGNTLLLTPLIDALEREFPGAEVELVTGGSAAAEVFRNHPSIARIHSFPVLSYRHPLTVLGLLSRLRAREYDLVIDPLPRSRSGRFITGLLRARHCIGYAWGSEHRDRCLSYAADPRLAPAHHALAPVHLLRVARGANPAIAHDVLLHGLDLRLSPAERAGGRRRLESMLPPGAPERAGPILGLYAHATGAKRLDAAWWHELIARVRRTRPDAAIVEFVPHDGRARLEGSVPALYSTDLRSLAAALAATSRVVSADCGVMHLAVAARASVIGLFRTTDPTCYGPYGLGNQTVVAADVRPETVAALLAGDARSPTCASLPAREAPAVAVEVPETPGAADGPVAAAGAGAVALAT